MIGHLEVICGPMGSGKTEELLRRLTRVEIANRNFLLFKPKADNRYTNSKVITHDKRYQRDAIICDTSLDIFNSVVAFIKQKEIACIGIDEAQFFDNSLPKYILKITKLGIRVIVAGLDQTSEEDSFGTIPKLLALADEVVKQKAVCMQCGSENATKTRVLVIKKNKELVGGLDKYEPNCKECFNKNL